MPWKNGSGFIANAFKNWYVYVRVKISKLHVQSGLKRKKGLYLAIRRDFAASKSAQLSALWVILFCKPITFVRKGSQQGR